MAAEISKEVMSLKEEMVRLRRDFHQNPELGLKERRTAGVIERYLKDLNLTVSANIGGTGVVGLLKGGKPGKTLLLRADMDALPIPEQTDAAYRSLNKGVMHACGHDGHMAILLTVARILSERRESIPGTVKFVFQPGEEGFGGAKLMIADGVLENPRVDAAMALHLFTSIPSGVIGVRPGPIMASMDNFTITILGRGGHGAIPDEGVDAILMSAHVITALQSLISRETSPLNPLVVHVGTIRGGNAANVVADRVVLAGTVRTLDDRLRRSIPQSMTRILDGIIPAFRGTYEFEYEEGYPAVVNDETMTELARETAKKVVGRENVREVERGMISEDMAFVLREVPGCFFYVGAGGRGQGVYAPHHNARFDFDEDALMIGAEMMTRAAMTYLERG